MQTTLKAHVTSVDIEGKVTLQGLVVPAWHGSTTFCGNKLRIRAAPHSRRLAPLSRLPRSPFFAIAPSPLSFSPLAPRSLPHASRTAPSSAVRPVPLAVSLALPSLTPYPTLACSVALCGDRTLHPAISTSLAPGLASPSVRLRSLVRSQVKGRDLI